MAEQKQEEKGEKEEKREVKSHEPEIRVSVKSAKGEKKESTQNSLEEPNEEEKKLNLILPSSDFKNIESVEKKILSKDKKAVKSELAVNLVFVPNVNFRNCGNTTTEHYSGRVVDIGKPLRDLVEEIKNRILSLEFEEPPETEISTTDKEIKEEVDSFASIASKFISVSGVNFKEVRETEINPIEMESGVRTPSSVSVSESGVELESELDPLDEFFGLGGVCNASMDRPRLIFAIKAEDTKFEYIELLKRFLRESYRIHSEGLPNSDHFSTDFTEIRREVKADKSVYVMDVDEITIVGGENKNEKYFQDRMKELFSENYGFIVIYGSRGKIDGLKQIFGPSSVLPVPRVAESIESDKLFDFANLVWGKLDSGESITTGSLDSYVKNLEEMYHQKIEQITNNISNILKVDPSSEDEEMINGESILHYALKSLIVSYLREELDIDGRFIDTEHELVEGVADVYVDSTEFENLAIEVETLYGTGLPMLKLRERIESRLENGMKLWLIIPSPQLTLYLNEILKLRGVYRRRFGDRFEIYTPKLGSKKLVSLVDFQKELNELIVKKTRET